MANEMKPVIGSGENAVVTADTANFERTVIEASKHQPVLVDFWAPWCEPCKQLTPILEKVVRETRGAVRLAKVNIDENPQLAQALHIQSVPVVYMFQDGRAIDGFIGGLPESQVRTFVERFAGAAEAGGAPAEEGKRALEGAKAALKAGDVAAASHFYQRVLSHDKANPEAVAGLLRCHLAMGDVEGARGFIDKAPEAVRAHAQVTSAIAALEFAEQGSTPEDVVAARARLDRNGNDHMARRDLALALFGLGRREEAVEELLESLRRDREWNNRAAQKLLLRMFEAMGADDPLTRSGRQRLSTLLFV
jgi:putative thioredoxin